MSSSENKPVSVDPGDLAEAIQAAQAWASVLRRRAADGKYEFSGNLTPKVARQRYEAAADRIDFACGRLRGQAYNLSG